MNDVNRAEYTSVARALHWVVALFVVLQFVFIFTAEALPREDEMRDTFFHLHFSTGFTVLVLATWRLVYRFMNPPPAPEHGQPPLLKRAALAAHWLMYLLIFALPITGWMLVATAGGAIDWYWLAEIPNFIGKNEVLHEQLEEVHEILGWLLLVVASIHLLAALWHHFIRKDDTLRRMLTGR